MKNSLILSILLFWVPASMCLATEGILNQDAANEEKAKKLIQQVDDMYRSAASRATMTMRVQTPNYQRSMTMESYTIGEEKMLIRILAPKKERGISTLKLDKEMWNFFPKINKTIKVPPSMMMGSWMGSDFTNDDLVKETSLTDDYALSLDESSEIYTITLTPRYQTVTVWDKIIIKIDKEKHTPIEQAFYDEKNRKVRIMSYREPKQFGSVILPSVLEMVPLNKEGHKTLVTYDKLELNAEGVEEDFFTLRSLKRRLR
ncbi:MAG: outer membrane lipoprotein-sorting protein [Oceanicoccus sp.]